MKAEYRVVVFTNEARLEQVVIASNEVAAFALALEIMQIAARPKGDNFVICVQMDRLKPV